jgi:SAM-dependent methyltransferase
VKRLTEELVNHKLRPRLWYWDYLGLRPLLEELKAFSRMAESEGAKGILDLGCGIKPYRPLFPYAQRYVGFDREKHDGVDVVGLNWELPFMEGEFDALISTQVFEHTRRVAETVQEIRRVVKHGGLIFISVPLAFPEHETPSDFWRFTKYGLREIFEEFDIIRINPQSGYLNTLMRLLNAFLAYLPGSGYWLAPVFFVNNVAGILFDRIAHALGQLAPLRESYERLYLGFTESYVVVLRNKKNC